MAQHLFTPVPPRARRYYARPPEEIAVARPNKHPRVYPVPFFIGMAIIAMVILVLQLVIFPWWTGITNQWHYGDAKAFATSGNVGHGGVSQFLAFDEDGQIVVIEIIGKKYAVYQGASFIGQPRQQRIITLTVRDVNHDGKPDLVIHIQGEDGELVLFNTGSAFQWTQR